MPRKRGAGEGSIAHRSDGRWQARYTTKDEAGKTVRKSIYGKTRKAVAEELARTLSDIHKGQYIPASTQTLADFLKYWLEDSKRPSLKPSTYENYEATIKHLAGYFKTTQLQKLAPQQVEAYKNSKMKTLAAKTVNSHMTLLRSALGQAVRWNIVQHNVAAYVDKPKIPRFHGTFLTPENAQLLLEAVKGTKYEIAILLALGAGLRRGEILGLHWRDIDFERGLLSVRTVQTKTDRKALSATPKSDTSKRTLMPPQFVLEALQAHREAQRLQCIKAMSRCKWEENDLVVCSIWGKPITPSAINRSLKNILIKRKMPLMRVHDLRHSFASIMEGQGVSLKTLSTMLGHANIGITADLYVHTFDSALENAAGLMDNLLGKKPVGVGLASEATTEAPPPE